MEKTLIAADQHTVGPPPSLLDLCRSSALMYMSSFEMVRTEVALFRTAALLFSLQAVSLFPLIVRVSRKNS